MKRLSLLSLLFASTLFNSGFWNNINNDEPEIRGIICGSEISMKVLKDNFSVDEIYTGEPEERISEVLDSDDEYLYTWLLDINTGHLYDLEDSNEFVTTFSRKYEDYYYWDDSKYVYFVEKKGNKIIVNIHYFEQGLKIEEYTEILNLSKLTNTWTYDGEEGTDKCMYFPFPGIIKIKE